MINLMDDKLINSFTLLMEFIFVSLNEKNIWKQNLLIQLEKYLFYFQY